VDAAGPLTLLLLPGSSDLRVGRRPLIPWYQALDFAVMPMSEVKTALATTRASSVDCGLPRGMKMGWTITGAAVALLSVVGVGWRARRRLDRASHSPDSEKARIAQELNRQIDRGRGTNGWL